MLSKYLLHAGSTEQTFLEARAYMHIYVCVCVNVCIFKKKKSTRTDLSHQIFPRERSLFSNMKVHFKNVLCNKKTLTGWQIVARRPCRHTMKVDGQTAGGQYIVYQTWPNLYRPEQTTLGSPRTCRPPIESP